MKKDTRNESPKKEIGEHIQTLAENVWAIASLDETPLAKTVWRAMQKPGT